MSVWKFPNFWKHVVFWGGLRGVIPVALALSLGGDKLISSMTFGVVVFSLVFQGITLEWFIRKWFRDTGKDKADEILARYIAAKSAKFELLKAVESGRIVVPDGLMKDIDMEIEEAKKELEKMLEKNQELAERGKKFILDAKKSAIREANARGIISHETAEKLLREIDMDISEIHKD